jgi:hypothetical protein
MKRRCHLAVVADFSNQYLTTPEFPLTDAQAIEDLPAIQKQLEQAGRASDSGKDFVAAWQSSIRLRNGGQGRVFLILLGIRGDRLTPETKARLEHRLSALLRLRIDWILEQFEQTGHRSKTLLVPLAELEAWYNQEIRPDLVEIPPRLFVPHLSPARPKTATGSGGGTPWLRIAAAVLVMIGVGGLATYTLFWGDGTRPPAGNDRPQVAPPVSASDDDPWADYRQHLEARYPEQAQETLVALCKAAKDQGIHAKDCDIASTAERPTAVANALNNEPWFPGWVDCVTGSRDEEALATFFKLTDELGPQLIPALGETRETGDEVRTQCGEDITGKVVEVREALYEMVDQLQNDGNRARFVAGVFGKTTSNGSDEPVTAVVEAIDAKEPTTALALVTSQDEETAETLYRLFNRDNICDAPGCESLGEILTVELEQQLTATGWNESELGAALLRLKTTAEALPDPVRSKTIAQ